MMIMKFVFSGESGFSFLLTGNKGILNKKCRLVDGEEVGSDLSD